MDSVQGSLSPRTPQGREDTDPQLSYRLTPLSWSSLDLSLLCGGYKRSCHTKDKTDTDFCRENAKVLFVMLKEIDLVFRSTH